MKFESKKLAILTNMAAPYRNSFFRNLAKSWDLLVIYNIWSEKDRSWQVDQENIGFNYLVLNSSPQLVKRLREDVGYEENRWKHGGKGIYASLKKFSPEIIVTIEFGARTLWSIFYALPRRIPVIVWWEGTRHTEKHSGFLKNVARRIFTKLLSGAFVNGVESKQYLEDIGFSPDQIQMGMTGTDTLEFSKQVDQAALHKENFKEQLHLIGPVFLFSGQLSPRKGVHSLLQAAELLSSDNNDIFSILFVGEGEERSLIESYAKKTNFPRIHITGFVQPSELAKYYALADFFVLPTLDDNWPLVTIEAISAGLPQIFSKYNGASADFSDSEEFGMICDPLDVKNLASCLCRAIKQEKRRLPLALRQEKINYYSGEQQARRATDFLSRFI